VFQKDVNIFVLFSKQHLYIEKDTTELSLLAKMTKVFAFRIISNYINCEMK